MMTFLVIGDFRINASLLDTGRLGKQRVEARQILDAIMHGTGWKNHPITHAWKDYIPALQYYTNCIILEWIKRGGANNLPLFDLPKVILMPWWVTWDRLHQSHRAMLYRKNPFFYKSKFEVEPEYMNYGYIWPNKVSYDTRDSPLQDITDPIPPYLINPVYCDALLKSGDNKGQSCNRLIKDPDTKAKRLIFSNLSADLQHKCTIHRK